MAKLKSDAALRRSLITVQPYYAAYLHITGGQQIGDFCGGEYLAWCRRMWREFSRQTGVSIEPSTQLVAHLFGPWLTRVCGLDIPEGVVL